MFCEVNIFFSEKTLLRRLHFEQKDVPLHRITQIRFINKKTTLKKWDSFHRLPKR